jgi:hypothetical protein
MGLDCILQTVSIVHHDVKLEVLTAMLLKIQVLWDVKPQTDILEKLAASIFRLVQEAWITLTMTAASCTVDCVVLDVSKNHSASIFRVNRYNTTECLTLKMEALKSFALSGTVHPTPLGELVTPRVSITVQVLCYSYMDVSCVPKIINIEWNPIK